MTGRSPAPVLARSPGLRNRPDPTGVVTEPRAAWDEDISVLSVASIGIDYRYQRDPNMGRVKRIALAWDMSLCGTIDVNQRPDGTYWVIEGQHRLLAARQAGEQEILCFVHHKATVEEEAAFFHAKDKNRAALGSLANMRSLWMAGDEQVRAVVATVERCGYHVASASGRQNTSVRPNDIQAANALWDLSRHSTKSKNDPRRGTFNGPRLERVLRLVKATWPDTPGAVSSDILYGIDVLLRVYGDDLDQGRFATKLGKLNPRVLVTDARSMSVTDRRVERRTWMAIAMAKAYNYKVATRRLEVGRLFDEHEIGQGRSSPGSLGKGVSLPADAAADAEGSDEWTDQ